MRSIQRPNQYLRLRHDVWHYVRRVPKSVRHIDERVLIYRSLETDSRKVARQRRDICAAADDQRWSEITPSRFGTPAPDAVMKDLQQRAQAFGFTYMPVSEIVDKLNGEQIVQRVTALGPINVPPITKTATGCGCTPRLGGNTKGKNKPSFRAISKRDCAGRADRQITRTT